MPRDAQSAVFRSLMADARLTSSARRQIQIFLELLESDSTIGFDTTAALFFGFLANDEFVEDNAFVLTGEEVRRAREFFRQEARIGRALECGLLPKVARLPLAPYLGPQLDLKDLAVSFLTYASYTHHFTYSERRVRNIRKRLALPEDVYLNVHDLFFALSEFGISMDDFIINLSRLRGRLIPTPGPVLSIVHTAIFDRVAPQLPGALLRLNGPQLEAFVWDCYEREGFRVVRVGRGPYSPDGGVDLIAYTDGSSLLGDLQVAIQCKATVNRVDVAVVRGFNTSIGSFNSHKGVFIAGAGFTKNAVQETADRRYPIDLLDYAELTNRIRHLVVKT